MVGLALGPTVGHRRGSLLGDGVGIEDKLLVDFSVGLLEGGRVGDCDGFPMPFGFSVGSFEGTLLGDGEGSEDRLPVGLRVGLGEGCWVGDCRGSVVGLSVGQTAGH